MKRLFLTPLLLASLCMQAQLCPKADVVYINGNILTGVGLEGKGAPPEGIPRAGVKERVWDRPHDGIVPARVREIGVANGKIWWVANDSADSAMLARCGAKTVIDLHRAFVMPGFNDAHTHMAEAGQQQLSVNLVGATSLAEMLVRIRTYAAKAQPGQWILGGGWDHTRWASKILPTRQDLDAVTAGHPAMLYRVDGHIVVANTAALYAANISTATKDPDGGRIDRAADGSATGIVRERPAIALLEPHIPKPDTATRRKALELSIADALSHGVTSVQTLAEWDDFLVLESMERAGKLPIRVAQWLDFDTQLPILDVRRLSHSADDPLLHLTMLKGFMDGSLGSRTAALNAPYKDDPTNSGLPRYDQAKLNGLADQRAFAGFQVGFHAIGDRANDMALDALEEAEQAGVPAAHPAPPRDPDASVVTTASREASPREFRFRIEHAQVVSTGAFDRFAKLGVIASMQPSHLLTDMAWAGDRLGPERSRRAYAWRSFLQHGVTLAFGTDYPVESISPFRGLYAAVTRMNEAGTQTFVPEEKLTINEAIYAYTQAPAFAEFRESIKGRLEPGYLADFVVLDRDITKASPQELLHTQVLRTVVGGTTVYSGGTALSAPLPVPDEQVHHAAGSAD